MPNSFLLLECKKNKDQINKNKANENIAFSLSTRELSLGFR